MSLASRRSIPVSFYYSAHILNDLPNAFTSKSQPSYKASTWQHLTKDEAESIAFASLLSCLSYTSFSTVFGGLGAGGGDAACLDVGVHDRSGSDVLVDFCVEHVERPD